MEKYSTATPHVVILGGGFAGMAAARSLARSGVRITLIDRSNHHLFVPLLYQVASGALPAPEISVPIRRLLGRQANVTVLMAEVRHLDVAARQIDVGQGLLTYDYLIVATGMTHSYFGHGEWAQHAPGLKTVGEALDVRRRILRAFEVAELSATLTEQRALTTFVVVGAGPTGVELAGAIAEMRRHTLASEFRRFDSRTARVVLVEAGPRILPSFDEDCAEDARVQLERLGVEIRTQQPVSHVDAEGVVIGDERLDARTVLWAAGVRASALTAQLGAPLDRSGRVSVEADLSVPTRPEVFVAGDLIHRTQDGKGLPGVAQLALQSGRHVGACIAADLAGAPRPTFRYRDKGMMATIGRNMAVAQIGRVKLRGMIAWWLWLIVHLLSLVERRRRFSVLWEWAWSYLTRQRGSRVIVDLPRTALRLSADEIPTDRDHRLSPGRR